MPPERKKKRAGGYRNKPVLPAATGTSFASHCGKKGGKGIKILGKREGEKGRGSCFIISICRGEPVRKSSVGKREKTCHRIICGQEKEKGGRRAFVKLAQKNRGVTPWRRGIKEKERWACRFS